LTERGHNEISHERAGAPCLSVEGVAFRYPHFELAATSFEAQAGEVLAIIGPNGSGKSTLLEIVSGRLEPAAGEVRLDGQMVDRLSPRERARRVGVARQETPLLFAFEVSEFVRQGRHPHLGRGLFENGEDERWVTWAMEMADLGRLAGRPVAEISGGELQRAVLARALAQRPRLLLLDEPTANLDIRYQIEMLRLIRRLARAEKFVAVIVTHELNLAAEFADGLLVLDSGRPVAVGPPGRVLGSELLSRVFRTPVLVDTNPATGRPRVTWITPGPAIPEAPLPKGEFV
jgi:ABC-type cobalamin/Fe3+-siderophores transport system ATPase subunit